MLHRFVGRFLSLFKGNEKADVRGREKKNIQRIGAKGDGMFLPMSILAIAMVILAITQVWLLLLKLK
jgi:hypothetical protein